MGRPEDEDGAFVLLIEETFRKRKPLFILFVK
jgi:hypothetical protein